MIERTEFDRATQSILIDLSECSCQVDSIGTAMFRIDGHGFNSVDINDLRGIVKAYDETFDS